MGLSDGRSTFFIILLPRDVSEFFVKGKKEVRSSNTPPENMIKESTKLQYLPLL